VKGVRLAPGLILAVMLFGLWLASGLEMSNFMGPGPGLFPTFVLSATAVIAGLLLAIPRLAGPDISAEEQEGEPDRRNFAACIAALLFMVPATAWMGFTAAALGSAVLMTWYGERRSLPGTILFGLVCAAVGVNIFGVLLRVDIPQTALEAVIQRQFR
jgi:hypothetical protein